MLRLVSGYRALCAHDRVWHPSRKDPQRARRRLHTHERVRRARLPIRSEARSCSKEQAAVSEEINRNIVAISDMAENSEQNGQKSVELSNELLEKLEEQQSLVKQFN